MPETVSGSETFGLTRGQHRTVFRNPRGNKRYYAFYIDNSSGDVTVEWSSDGIDWSNTPQAVAVEGGTIDSFDVKIRDTSSDTISWGTLRTVAVSITDTLAGLHCIAIARTDNARLVIGFTEDIHTKCKDYRTIHLIGGSNDSDAPTWSGETTWDNPDGSTNNQSKDLVHFGLESYSGSVLSGNGVLIGARVPESTNTSTYQVVSDEVTWNGTAFGDVGQTTVGASARANPHGDPLSILIDAADFSHIVWLEGTAEFDLDHKKSGTAGADDWGSASEIKAGTSSSNRIDTATLALDTRGGIDLPSSTEFNEWSTVGCATAHECIDEYPPDDVTTRLTNATM
jgi:hypothetical protein